MQSRNSVFSQECGLGLAREYDLIAVGDEADEEVMSRSSDE